MEALAGLDPGMELLPIFPSLTWKSLVGQGGPSPTVLDWET